VAVRCGLALRRPIARERGICLRGSAWRRGDRGDLPAARRHSVGDRAGGGARVSTWHRGGRHPPRRSLSAAEQRKADSSAAAPDVAGDA
jgi:hypothetical protein